MRVTLAWGMDRFVTGLERYARELIKALRGRADLRIVEFRRKEVTVFGRPLGGYFSVWLQKAAYRPRAGLLHALDPSSSPPRPDVLTVHDLIPFKFLDLYQRGLAQGLGHLVNLQAILSARKLIVPTEHVEGDVMSLVGRAPEDIHVIPEGVDTEAFRPLDGAREERTILFVGDNNPRKNLTRLVQAVALLDPPATLVRLGSAKWREERRKVDRLVRDLGVRLVEPGWVTDEEMTRWLNRCTVFAFPTLDEGFGLPPLEALACGTPVIVSDIPPHRAHMEGAAVFVDPWTPESIADGLEKALNRTWDAAKLRGVARRFPWSRSAEETVKVYEGLAGSGA